MCILDYFRSVILNPTPAAIFPTLIVLFIVLFFIYYFMALRPRKGTVDWIHAGMKKDSFSLISSRYPMEKRDIIPFILIILVFLFLAVFNLGGANVVDVMTEITIPAAERPHMRSLYFDEIFFVRTAVEHIEGLRPYEISHPPLGKEIISASILTFGMTPLGWRLLGAVCGVIMLAVMYIFIKNMFGNTFVASCATLLFGFDFMRFVQTRIGTIDTYCILFILLAFFFMYRHITTDPDADFRKSLLPLAFSGLFFGLSFAVKWTGFYAGAGLLLLYIIRLIQLGLHYNSTQKSGFGLYLTKTLLFSLLFFVIIPSVIYYLSYIPYGIAAGMSLSDGMLWNPEYFNIILNNQIYMFNYHSKLVAEHPFSSYWWQWILNIRPILYESRMSGDLRATFGSFGNPVIWWGGIAAMIVMFIRVFIHKDGKAFFILIGYLSQLLPWVAVSRIVFIYHYFPSTLFIILAFAHIFNTIIKQRDDTGRSIVYGYTVLAGIVFIIFYPQLSGIYLPGWYFKDVLKWFITWPF